MKFIPELDEERDLCFLRLISSSWMSLLDLAAEHAAAAAAAAVAPTGSVNTSGEWWWCDI